MIQSKAARNFDAGPIDFCRQILASAAAAKSHPGVPQCRSGPPAPPPPPLTALTPGGLLVFPPPSCAPERVLPPLSHANRIKRSRTRMLMCPLSLMRFLAEVGTGDANMAQGSTRVPGRLLLEARLLLTKTTKDTTSSGLVGRAYLLRPARWLRYAPLARCPMGLGVHCSSRAVAIQLRSTPIEISKRHYPLREMLARSG
jgi:hypothetical protein